MSLDLAFVLDCTGSMGSYIQMSKDMINDVVLSVLEDPNIDSCRLAMVAYEDYCDGKNLIDWQDFLSSPNEFKAYVSKLRAGGGGDFPEALEVALEKLPGLAWRPGSAHVVVIITDAPPHGVANVGGDSYAKGSKDGDAKHHFASISQRLAVSSLNLRMICVNVTNNGDTARGLKEIATVVGGMYCVIGNTQELSKFISNTASSSPDEAKVYGEVLAEFTKRANEGNIHGLHSLNEVGAAAGLTGKSLAVQVARILSSRGLPPSLAHHKTMLNTAANSIGAEWIKKGNASLSMENVNVHLQSIASAGNYAKITVDYPLKNTSESAVEVSFRLPLPESWCVDLVKFKLSEEDEWKVCTIESKKKAQDRYDDAVASGGSAVMVEFDPSGNAVTISVGNLKPEKTCHLQASFSAAVDAVAGNMNFPSILFPAVDSSAISDYGVTVVNEGFVGNSPVLDGAQHRVSEWPLTLPLTSTVQANSQLLWSKTPLQTDVIPLGPKDVIVKVRYVQTEPQNLRKDANLLLLPDPWSLRSPGTQRSLQSVVALLTEAVAAKILPESAVAVVLPKSDSKGKCSYVHTSGMGKVREAVSSWLADVNKFDFSNAYLSEAINSAKKEKEVFLFIDSHYFHEHAQIVSPLFSHITRLWIAGASGTHVVSGTGSGCLADFKNNKTVEFAPVGNEAALVRSALHGDKREAQKATVQFTPTDATILHSTDANLQHSHGKDVAFIHLRLDGDNAKVNCNIADQTVSISLHDKVSEAETKPTELGPDARIALFNLTKANDTNKLEYALRWAILCEVTALIAEAEASATEDGQQGAMTQVKLQAPSDTPVTLSSSSSRFCSLGAAPPRSYKATIGYDIDDVKCAMAKNLDAVLCREEKLECLSMRSDELACASLSFKASAKRKSSGSLLSGIAGAIGGVFSKKTSAPAPVPCAVPMRGSCEGAAFGGPPPPPPCGPPPPPACAPCMPAMCAPPSRAAPIDSLFDAAPECEKKSKPSAPAPTPSSAEVIKVLTSLLKRRAKSGLPFKASEAVLSLLEIIVPRSTIGDKPTDKSISSLIVGLIEKHLDGLAPALAEAGITIEQLKEQLTA